MLITKKLLILTLNSTLMLASLLADAAELPARLSYLEQQNAQLTRSFLEQKKQLNQFRRTLLDQSVKMLELQKNLQSLQGQIEELNHQLEQMKLVLDNRLNELQQAPDKKLSIENYTGLEKRPGEPPKTQEYLVAAEEDNQETQAYQQALELVQIGRYDSAITELKEFLNQYPQSHKAYEAQYWLAEMYYRQNKINLALTAFSQLLEKYPNSPKQADALLKIADIYSDKKDYATARAIYQQVIETYPGTEAADLAEKRLRE